MIERLGVEAGFKFKLHPHMLRPPLASAMPATTTAATSVSAPSDRSSII
jgi:hypothetical protein